MNSGGGEGGGGGVGGGRGRWTVPNMHLILSTHQTHLLLNTAFFISYAVYAEKTLFLSLKQNWKFIKF